MLSDKIKELRLARDLSQEDLAEVLDVTRQSISKYENGTAEPSLEKIKILAAYFDVTYDYLLDDNVEVQDMTYGKRGKVSPADAEEKAEETVEPSKKPRKKREDTPAEAAHRRKEEEIDALPRIQIQSKIEEDGESEFYKFEILEKFPHVDYKPTALLCGVHSRTFLFENRTDIAWYRTMEDAEKEVEAIHRAIEAGETAYELQYDAPVKKRGFFSVQLADVEVNDSESDVD